MARPCRIPPADAEVARQRQGMLASNADAPHYVLIAKTSAEVTRSPIPASKRSVAVHI